MGNKRVTKSDESDSKIQTRI